MKSIVLTLLVTCCVTFLVSCSYNKNELPEPIEETTPVPTPTTNQNTITYTSHVKVMMDDNCVVCHSASGTNQQPFLTTYTQVKTQADAGRILARAINGSGNGPMPPSGLMSQTTLDTLQMWLDQGALE